MGKKQARIDELEHELEVANSKANQHWLSLKSALHGLDLAVRRLEAEKAKPKFYNNTIGDPADKKIIENQKQTILELHKQVDVLADQRNNAIDRAERAEAKSDGWSDAYTNQVGALHEQCDQLRDELAELKAKQSPFALAIPESYKLKSKDQEIRELNLYITRLTEERDDLKKQSGDMSEAWVKVRVDFEKQVKLTEMVRKERDHFAGKCGQLQNQLNEVRVAARVTL